MRALPTEIASEEELERVLAIPYSETVAMMRRLPGDLMLLGAGGKMGPSLAHLAINAVREAGVKKRVIAVSRFSDAAQCDGLERLGVVTIACDLFDVDALERLPHAENIIFMAGRKFGVVGDEPALWMTNAVVPGNVARIFRESNFVVFSTGCVYPLVAESTGGSVETDALDPVGEYSYSCVARERVFEHYSNKNGPRVLFFRLNYSIDLRYGVLVDIAQSVFERRPVDLTVSVANVIWQGDANNRALLCLEHTASPPAALNVTSPEILRVEDIARRFAEMFGVEAQFAGTDSGVAYLSNAGRSIEMFGPPRVSVEQMMEWIVDWIRQGNRLLGKPTHFSTTDGQFLDEKGQETDRP